MSLLNAFRHRTLVQSLRQSRSASLSPARLIHVRADLSRTRWQTWKPSSAPMRSESTAAKGTGGYKYPEILNIYRPPINTTIFIGLARVFSIGAFLYGSTFMTFSMYSNPEVSNLWVPLVPLVSAIPMVATALCTGPMIHGISAILPSLARRSRDDLLRFAENPPADFRLQMWFMRFIPWPQVREVRFADLRRLKPSWRAGIANLEHVPASNREFERSSSFWFVLARNYMGRFFVNVSLVKDQSAAPGIWKHVWERIPMAGEEVLIAKRSRKPMTRSQRPAYAQLVRPPVPGKQGKVGR